MGVKRNTEQPDLGKDRACLEPLGVADVICSRSERLSSAKSPLLVCSDQIAGEGQEGRPF